MTESPKSRRSTQLPIEFPREERDDEQSLGWWERKISAGCEQLGPRVDRGAIARRLGATLRQLRDAAKKARRSMP